MATLTIDYKVITLTTKATPGLREHPDLTRHLNEGWSISACHQQATAGSISAGSASLAEFRFCWLIILSRLRP